MSKPKKQPKPEAAVKTEAAISKTEGPEKAPEAKSPRLSDSLKAQADHMIAARDKKQAPASREARPPKAKDPNGEENLVVFAFRLSPEERELIHKAAGPARASRFVRALAVAAACGDEGAIKLLLQSAKATA
ncbi:MAG: hypothetical protein A2Z17_00545 [Gammaproteobacteria bacterium RBG_16_66_13]|nr:MAG: hypothetical protein A2Z17_00545 [Gammaproteobacteria bacterium RBG_16_66_13]